MRKQGTITRWEDDRGFGFISHDHDAGDIFVHITEFPRTSRRPEVGDTVFYRIGKDKSGKAQAVSVSFTDEPEAPRTSAGKRSRGVWSVMFALLFVGFLVAAATFNRLPWLVVGVYGVMSLMTFIAYGWDKAKAKLGKWRTPESTLHLMGLLGGWPGGFAAQRLLRHKSSKQEFLLVFWGTVALNVLAAGYLVWSGDAVFVSQWFDKVWSHAG